MKSSRRWLIVFAVAIGILMISSLGLVLFSANKVSLLPENTPQGTVQRYLMAIHDKDYPKAYTYYALDAATTPGNVTNYDTWLAYVLPQLYFTQSVWKATLGTINESGSVATVDVIIDTMNSNGLFGNSSYSQTYTFSLVKTGNYWLITAGNNSYGFPGSAIPTPVITKAQ